MKIIPLNWKRSLAALALLAAFHDPAASPAGAEPAKPAAVPESALKAAPGVPASVAVREVETRPAGVPPAPALPPPARVSRERSGPDGKGAGPAARGAKLEARLKQILLSEIKFDGQPLSEVLRILQEAALKHDPDKLGVNFLIKPTFKPIAARLETALGPGLPPPGARVAVDAGRTIIRFNLPLRNITLKDLLDAIVLVADYPIEYTLEDYAVVFSLRPEAPMPPPGAPMPPGMRAAPEPGLPCPGNAGPATTASWQSRRYKGLPCPGNAGPATWPHPFPADIPLVPPRKKHWSSAELAKMKPQPFNVDFGPSEPSRQVGPAATGRAGDFWNVVSRSCNNHHTAVDLRFASGDPSPIEVELINLGGAWGVSNAWSERSPMLVDYNYPTGNRGGDSTVILRQAPAGKYQMYLYGAGATPGYFGDYSVSVGGREYGRKQTTRKGDGFRQRNWVEGIQYVRFTKIKVQAGEAVTILIRPGDPVTDPHGRTFADAFIAGLQLVPSR